MKLDIINVLVTKEKGVSVCVFCELLVCMCVCLFSCCIVCKARAYVLFWGSRMKDDTCKGGSDFYGLHMPTCRKQVVFQSCHSWEQGGGLKSDILSDAKNNI